MHVLASKLDQNTIQELDQQIKRKLKNGSKDQKLNAILMHW